MTAEVRHLSNSGKVLRFVNEDRLYPVNQYQSLVLATASELAAHGVAARTGTPLAELAAWEPCCGGGPTAISLKSMGIGYVQATDINDDSVAACIANARNNDVELDRVERADLLADGGNRQFDLISCNPPCGADAAGPASMSPQIRTAVEGGETGIELTMRLLEQVAPRLSEHGSLIFVAVSTSDIYGLRNSLDARFPGKWRTFPSTPVAAPYRRTDDADASWLVDQTVGFEPLVWRRDDGWYWRLSWIIEVSRGLPSGAYSAFTLCPYGLEVSRDPGLAELIGRCSDDGLSLR
jgi:predicted RNA methylase